MNCVSSGNSDCYAKITGSSRTKGSFAKFLVWKFSFLKNTRIIKILKGSCCVFKRKMLTFCDLSHLTDLD